MSANVPQTNDTKSSTPWYKEGAGFVAVIAWLAIILVNTWAILTNTIIPNPSYLAVLFFIAVIASGVRGASAKLRSEREK